MIAKAFGQDPRAVAAWEPDWLAACLTVLGAEADARVERQARLDRAARRRSASGGL